MKINLKFSCMGMLMAMYTTASIAQNPISPMGVYIADPSGRVMNDGKLYVYGSLDTVPDAYCSNRYHVLSSKDACQWTLHRNAFEWEETMYAPDAFQKGKTCYLYYDTPDGKEYVVTGKSPTGPFDDATLIACDHQIDPCILMDDDGQAYYFWGQFSSLGAKMTPDLKNIDPATVHKGVVTEENHWFHEGSWVTKRGKYYYYVFADISRDKRPTCLGYAMATSPFGPYEYKGVIIDNNGCDPAVWNNHGSIVQHGDKWYVLYHRSTHNSVSMRKACIERIFFNEDGTIDEVEMTTQGAGAPLDAMEKIDAARCCWRSGNCRIQGMEGRKDREELACIRHSDTAAWKYLEFGQGANKVTLCFKSTMKGYVKVHIDSQHGPVVGTIDIPKEDKWTEASASIKTTQGVHAVWLEFCCPEAGESDFMELDYLSFQK